MNCLLNTIDHKCSFFLPFALTNKNSQRGIEVVTVKRMSDAGGMITHENGNARLTGGLSFNRRQGIPARTPVSRRN